MSEHYHVRNELDYIYKENFFTEEELCSIWKELEFINSPLILEDPGDTGTAVDDDGVPLKQNSGVFLDRLFVDYARVSSIYNCASKIFQGSTLEYSKLSFNSTAILSTRKSSCLVSYYDHGDSYKEHHDLCVVTCLFWFYKEPKKFSGGDLFLPQFNKTFSAKNNSMLMFPSHARHLVTPVLIEEENRGKGLGRYCVTVFLQH